MSSAAGRLDLRAVESRLNWWKNVADYDDSERVKATADDVDALLAHCRALRAALQAFHGDISERVKSGDRAKVYFPNQVICMERAAEVLAAAVDAAGAAPEETPP